MGDTQLSKEQIQMEYAKTMGFVGDKLTRFFKPLIEAADLMRNAYGLNQQMEKILQSEAKLQEKTDKELGA